MQEELMQLQIQKVWILVDLPCGKKAIGTKWVHMNKKDERGVVVRNKSAFLYGIIAEEVYVSQSYSFVDPKFPNKVYKVVKAPYGLHQAPRAWSSRKKMTASTPIETQKPLVKDEEAADVDVHLYRFQVTPKASHLQAMKRIFRYLKGQPKLGLWYPKVSSFDLEAYSGSDYTGVNLNKKSTTGCCQFLGRRLIAWQCKKHTIVATSTTEAKYVTVARCCGKVLDAYEKKLIQVLKIHTDDNVADLLTKAFDVSRLSIAKLDFYAFTISPDVCASFIEQFWKTTTFKTINNISQIHAKVAGKPIVITEASIRGDLLFNDVDGIDCKITPFFPSMLAQAAVAEGEDLGTPIDSQPTPFPTQPSARDQPTLTKSSLEHYSSQDPIVDLKGTGFLLWRLSRMLRLKKSFQYRLELRSWKRGGRKNAKSGPTKDDSDKLNAELDKDMEYIDTKEALNEGRLSTVDTTRPDVSTARPDVSTARPDDVTARPDVSTTRPDDDTARPDISTARQELSTVGPTTTPTITTIFDDEEMNLADTLTKLKDDKAKVVAFKDSESTDRPARLILTLKPLPTIDPKDKRKGVLEEPDSAKKMNKSNFDDVQIARDEEISRQLEVELIHADHELAVRWTHEEQEKYTMDKRAKLFAEYFERWKKQLAEERAVAIRNKPPTKTQLRRLMMTYLKNVGRFTHSQLNKKSFEDIQGLYMKEQELIANFAPIGHGAEGIYYRIFRSDGSSRWIKTFSKMVTRVHILILEDCTEIHILAEKRYPLTTRTLKRMMSLRLIAESASDAAYDLLRFIQKQIDESRGYGRG
nr:hypothetical protein [Tanacetum cinerariifolium]